MSTSPRGLGSSRRPFLRTLLVSALIAALTMVQEPVSAADATCAQADLHAEYPPANAPPKIQASVADRASALSGADCFGEAQGGSMWVTVAASVGTSVDEKTLIERFGAISQLLKAQYWSTTDQAWRPLVAAAHAAEAANADTARPDYSVADMTSGTTLYYRVTDTRSDSAITYRMQLRSGPSHRIFIETANVDPVGKWGITLYAPGGVRTLYFLNEFSPGIWSYYSITRAVPATFLAKGHQKSYINRAVALFRYYMGLPATSDPPPAR